MSDDRTRFEGYIHGSEPRWNQSYYYQAYDPATRIGTFIRLGFLENQNESNSWLIVFRDGSPLYTRTNLNLPFTKDRPLNGVTLAGMRVHAEVPLKKTRITFDTPDFAMDLVWDELSPLEDCIAMSHDEGGTFSRELAHIHLEGTSRVTGHIVHRGERMDVDGKGFRDIAAGVRNWDGLNHYRLAWPVFENGTAFAGIHAIATSGGSAYMRMLYDGQQWRRVKQVEDKLKLDAEGLAITTAEWAFVDEAGKRYEMTAKPLFNWLYPLDTFVLREQLCEFKMKDGGAVGYGLHEMGFRLPWKGL